MVTITTTIHIIACLTLIVVVLLQAGKGASIGASFGAGGSQTIFGGRGPATFFQKFTTVVAVVFLLTSIGLARFAKVSQSKSVIDSIPAELGTPATSSGDTATTEESPAPEKTDANSNQTTK